MVCWLTKGPKYQDFSNPKSSEAEHFQAWSSNINEVHTPKIKASSPYALALLDEAASHKEAALIDEAV